MSENKTPLYLNAKEIPLREKPSNYPEPFFSRMKSREKRILGEPFGLTNFGVNLTRLKPGGISALLHRHTKQDEFIYILEGTATLKTEVEKVILKGGMCAGFPANGVAHQLLNETDEDVVYLEIGDRTKGDTATYPNDDLKAEQDNNGNWIFTHKNGTPYDE